MPLFLILIILCSSPAFSLAKKPKLPNETFFRFAYEGAIGGLRYSSRLADGNPYYEEFNFSEQNGITTVTLALRGETNTVRIGNDLNLVSATFTKAGRSLDVRLTRDGLVYSTNGVDFARYPVPAARVVIFPEIQLRDFVYSSTQSNISFTQLLTGDYRSAPMYARKRSITNLYTAYTPLNGGPAGTQQCLPVEILTTGLSPAEWAMVYYFDGTAWPILKQGYFNAGASANNNTVLMIPNNDSEMYYLSKPKYNSELINKTKKKQL